jgi:adenosine kinase
MEKNNIALQGIKIIRNEFTAGAYITTDQSDNQITGFNPGAMKYQSEYRFDHSEPEEAVCLIAPGNLHDMIEYAAICRHKKIPYICDPGQSLSLWDGKQMREWLDGSHMLISNDYELEMIMKLTGQNKNSILRLTQTIITTLGEQGSLVATSQAEVSIPAARTEKVADPTGAGDAYRAGLLKGIVEGRDIQTAAKMGAVAAVYAIEKYGTQEHGFTYEGFMNRYCTNFGEL